MLEVEIIRYNKNGYVKREKLLFKGTKRQFLKFERLCELAEDSYVDQGENWR